MFFLPIIIGGGMFLGFSIGGGITTNHYSKITKTVEFKNVEVDLGGDEKLKDIKSIGVGIDNWLELYDENNIMILSEIELLDWKTFLGQTSSIKKLNEVDIEVISRKIKIYLQDKGYTSAEQVWNNSVKKSLEENKNFFKENSDIWLGWLLGSCFGSGVGAVSIFCGGSYCWKLRSGR
ncbi:MAG: hypothetical protein ACRC4M_04540 [Mycoplasma sp.]